MEGKLPRKAKIENPDICPQCSANSWIGIPDSLASACQMCGFVKVGPLGADRHFEVGASLQEWAQDLSESSETKKREQTE